MNRSDLMFLEQTYTARIMQDFQAERCQTTLQHSITGLTPDPTGTVQRMGQTDFKFTAAKYHAIIIQTHDVVENLLFELNAFIMEIRGVWDQLRFEVAHYYCFYYDWPPPKFYNNVFFLKLLKKADVNAFQLFGDIWNEPW